MSEAPNDKTTRGVVDILVYATARLLLVVAVSAAIFGVARLIGLTEFPVVVATLFGLIIAMPLGIWVFSRCGGAPRPRSRWPVERRRAERERLRARLRGESLPEEQ